MKSAPKSSESIIIVRRKTKRNHYNIKVPTCYNVFMCETAHAADDNTFRPRAQHPTLTENQPPIRHPPRPNDDPTSTLGVHALGRGFRVPSRTLRVSVIYLYNSIVVRNIIRAPEKFEINTNLGRKRETETCGKYLVLGCDLIEYLLHESCKRMTAMFDTEEYRSMLLIFYRQMI